MEFIWLLAAIMHMIKYLPFMLYFSKLSLADLKSCSEKHDGLEICYTSQEGYSPPFPVNVVLIHFHLSEIIDIDVSKNFISIQGDLWTAWIDTGITLSKVSTT